MGRGRLSNSCSWNAYDVQGADQTPMLSGSRWFLASYSRGWKGDRCLRRELSELLECKSHGRTELCTLPGIQLSGGWGGHSRKGNTWLEADRERVYVCALGLRTSQGLVFPRLEAALFVPAGGGPGEGSALRTPVSTSPLTKLRSSQNRERPPQPRVRTQLVHASLAREASTPENQEAFKRNPVLSSEKTEADSSSPSLTQLQIEHRLVKKADKVCPPGAERS